MRDIFKKLKTTGLLLWNKGVAIIVLLLLLTRYITLDPDKPQPFAELLYAVILAASIIVVAPVVRLLVFPEAAEYAESGKVNTSDHYRLFSPALVHYWFATLISYGVTALCVSSLL
jgi:hypothetical protein